MDVRHKAAWALGRIRDNHAVEPLIAALKDEAANVKSTAAGALGEIGDNQAVEPLIAELKDETPDVRSAAVKALGKIKDVRAVMPLTTIALNDHELYIRNSAAEELTKIGKPAVNTLVSALKNENSVVRERAIGVLGGIRDTSSVAPLITMLKDNVLEVRKKAAMALGNIGDTCAVEPLIATLKNKDSGIRKEAAAALGMIRDARAVDPLIAALNYAALNYNDPSIQISAIEALAQIGNARALGPLLIALKNKNWDVREKAVEALGWLGEPAVRPLVALLKHSNVSIRKKATIALGQIGAHAVGPLITELRRRDWDFERDIVIKNHVVEALGKIGEPAVEPLIAALWSEYLNVSGDVARALAKIGRPAIDNLIRAMNITVMPPFPPLGLDDKERNTRFWAARTLMFMLDGDVLDYRIDDALMEALKSKDIIVLAGAYRFYLEKRVPGSEEILITALNSFGTSGMAEAFLSSDNGMLYEAAIDWARAYNYQIVGSLTAFGRPIAGTPRTRRW